MDKNNLVISLFRGIGLLDKAFEKVGYCIVAGPDLLWGGNIKTFHPPANTFGGLIGGPPCQAFSQLNALVKHNGYQVAEDLIPEFQRCVCEAQPTWFLMENVKAAPVPQITGYTISSVLLNNRWFGGEQNRNRVFNFGLKGTTKLNWWKYLNIVALENPKKSTAVLASGYRTKTGRWLNKNGASRASVAEAIRLQGLPPDFFKHSPFTVKAQQRMLGNGVPLPMGIAVANAIRNFLNEINLKESKV